ncbi:hypothetical protein [Vibrio mexicanus]|uniref:hypothetical protein n=1 Tax=Vibrio mexicanus TaxID=1004326 RepID=UPI00063C5F67|nr:hypothetical protein [Vibrio mexicanus]
MSTIDRLTIYYVLCFISICALFLRGPAEPSLSPLMGISATIIGIWLETHRGHDASEEQNN